MRSLVASLCRDDSNAAHPLLIILSAALVILSAALVILSALLVIPSALLVILSALLVIPSALLVILSALLVILSALLVILSAVEGSPSARSISQQSHADPLRSIRARLWVCPFQIERAPASCANAETDKSMGPIATGL